MAVVTMRQLLESGVHFGHQTRRWNPKMKRFILTERNGIYIIDLQQSLSFIDRAYEAVRTTVAHGGTILFVGTKKQAQDAIKRIAAETGGSILVTTDAKEAVKDADCVFTDTWVSMGEEAEYAIRSKPFWDYQVNTELMALAKPDALFQHCLPAYRGKEVTAEVIDGPQSVVWDEAENRLHAQKALLTWLTGKARGDESLLA